MICVRLCQYWITNHNSWLFWERKWTENKEERRRRQCWRCWWWPVSSRWWCRPQWEQEDQAPPQSTEESTIWSISIRMMTTYHSEHPLDLLVCATASETGDKDGDTGDDEEEDHCALVDRDAHLDAWDGENRHYNALMMLLDEKPTLPWSSRSRKEFLLTSAQMPSARIIQDNIWTNPFTSYFFHCWFHYNLDNLQHNCRWCWTNNCLIVNVIAYYCYVYFYLQRWWCWTRRGSIWRTCQGPPYLTFTFTAVPSMEDTGSFVFPVLCFLCFQSPSSEWVGER